MKRTKTERNLWTYTQAVCPIAFAFACACVVVWLVDVSFASFLLPSSFVVLVVGVVSFISFLQSFLC